MPDPEPDLEPAPKARKSKGGKTEQSDQNNEDMPTVAEVCENFGLSDVDLEYSDADYQNLTTYKLFQQTYRQRIQAANPKVKSVAIYKSFISHNHLINQTRISYITCLIIFSTGSTAETNDAGGCQMERISK